MEPVGMEKAVVVVRCDSTREVVDVLDNFLIMDDLNGKLLIVYCGPSDGNICKITRRFEFAALIEHWRGLEWFDLRTTIEKKWPDIQNVVVWPKKGRFARNCGINRAIEVRRKYSTDVVTGLINEQGSWQSWAGNIRYFSQSKSIVSFPYEITFGKWTREGKFGCIEVDHGGDLLVTGIECLRKGVPFCKGPIPLGLLLTLASQNDMCITSLLYTGLQVFVEQTIKNNIDEPNRESLGILFTFLCLNSIFEIIIFGRFKYVIDKDFLIIRIQEQGMLNAVGVEVGRLNYSTYYESMLSKNLIGPLMNYDDSQKVVSSHVSTDENRIMKIERLEKELSQMYKSHSWRITRPLRIIIDGLKYVLRKSTN